ncbi:MAG TPA: ATP-binding protein [Candidatus Mediterraneibacter cottocaccae]|nr:ATP-binding protein [Candidatus Mediterraneibacter cottocaccae]
MNQTEMKMLPVGIESFEKIRKEGFYYVDKTTMIRDLLRKWGEVNLFTRPRRFGKSLNMSMLKSFFEIGSDDSLFDGLAISQEKDLCEKYMGKFPVVSVSLKGIHGEDYPIARSLAVKAVNEEARRLEYLLKSENLSENDKELFSLLLQNEMTDETLICSLRELSELLYKHFEKKVIILIDEYDVPLAKANEQGYYDQMVHLIRSMFEQALKTNDSLYFAVLTGCLRVAKESIFTGLNNPKILSITSVRFDEYFGFTDSEVREMLHYYGLDEKYETFRDWYDGYRFGNVDVYCPWDVISYCDELTDDPSAEPKEYWSNTSGNDVVKKLLEKATADTRDDIERLIAGDTVTKEIDEDLTYKELYDKLGNVWSVLFTTGYLTQREKGSGNMRNLMIPNREVRNIFMTQIREWIQIKVREDDLRLNSFCDAFRNCDSQKVQALLTEYLEETISIRDTAVGKELKENFYHGFLLGLLRSRGDWKVFSNRESGNGYADIVIEIIPEKTGIVIELKYPDNGELEAGCREALAQINERNYEEQPRLDGMKKIIKCGIACHIKECKVVFENI